MITQPREQGAAGRQAVVGAARRDQHEQGLAVVGLQVAIRQVRGLCFRVALQIDDDADIDQCQANDPVRLLQCQFLTDCAAPVVSGQVETFDSQLVENAQYVTGQFIFAER